MTCSFEKYFVVFRPRVVFEFLEDGLIGLMLSHDHDIKNNFMAYGIILCDRQDTIDMVLIILVWVYFELDIFELKHEVIVVYPLFWVLLEHFPDYHLEFCGYLQRFWEGEFLVLV